MPKRFMSCVPAVFVGLSAGAIVLNTNYATLADDCLAGPNRPPAPGGHWYFHFDKAGNRKCWYLVEAATRPSTVEAPEIQPVGAPPQPTLGSFFSLMGLPGAPTGPQPARPDELRNDATAPQPGTARRPDTQAALAAKPHRLPPAARAPVERVDERPASPDQTERDALFQEFLRWRERK